MYLSTWTPICILALVASAPVLAIDVGNNDIPTQCVTVCSNLVAVSNDCDRTFRKESNELDCLCNATNAKAVIPLCVACVTQYSNDRNDTDVNNVLSSCSLSSTTYNPSSTYSVAVITPATNISSLNTGIATTTVTVFSSGASTSSVAASASSSRASQTSGSTSAAAASSTSNTAPGTKAQYASTLAAAALLLVAAAWL